MTTAFQPPSTQVLRSLLPQPAFLHGLLFFLHGRALEVPVAKVFLLSNGLLLLVIQEIAVLVGTFLLGQVIQCIRRLLPLFCTDVAIQHLCQVRLIAHMISHIIDQLRKVVTLILFVLRVVAVGDGAAPMSSRPTAASTWTMQSAVRTVKYAIPP